MSPDAGPPPYPRLSWSAPFLTIGRCVIKFKQRAGNTRQMVTSLQLWNNHAMYNRLIFPTCLRDLRHTTQHSVGQPASSQKSWLCIVTTVDTCHLTLATMVYNNFHVTHANNNHQTFYTTMLCFISFYLTGSPVNFGHTSTSPTTPHRCYSSFPTPHHTRRTYLSYHTINTSFSQASSIIKLTSVFSHQAPHSKYTLGEILQPHSV